MSRQLDRAIGMLIAVMLAAPVSALDSDRDQPIQIEADRLDVDDAKGISVYRGNVRYVQGSIVMVADEVQIFTNTNREVEKVLADGDPVTFEQRMESNQQLIKGRGQHMEYRALDQYLMLSGSANVSQCGNEFSGSVLEYFVGEEMVRATKDQETGERVQVVIQPRGDSPRTDPCAEPPKQ